MTAYVIALESPRGFQEKRVIVYLEDDNGNHRQVQRNVDKDLDVADFVERRFSQLWNTGQALDSAKFEQAFERQSRDLYREVVRAGIVEARVQGASLVDVTSAMETELLASGQAGGYNRFKSLMSGATAGQRDAFFGVVSFLVMRKFMGD